MKSLTKYFTYKYFNKMLFIFLLLSSQLFAAFEIKKYSVNSGGSKISSNRFQINASIAQVDANQTLSSNRFKLSPGFWQKLQRDDLIFNNSFE